MNSRQAPATIIRWHESEHAALSEEAHWDYAGVGESIRQTTIASMRSGRDQVAGMRFCCDLVASMRFCRDLVASMRFCRDLESNST